MKNLLKPSLNWLFLFIPITVALKFSGASGVLTFLASALAIIPLASWMGRAPEHLAYRSGPGISVLINATFGNAAEFIIALVALSNGLHVMVKASLTGSIIGNMLLILGGALLSGGLKFRRQTFSMARVSVSGTMLLLAVVGLLVPSVFAALPIVTNLNLRGLSLVVGFVLIVLYGLNLFFEFFTHRQLLKAEGEPVDSTRNAWGVPKSLCVLAGATAVIAWLSYQLVGSFEAATHALGLTEVFVGVIIVAIIGNVAEHSSAVLVARKSERLDLSWSIAIGSSLQIALFVAPVLVFASYLFGKPMDLAFRVPEMMAVVLSVFIVNLIASDGETSWLEGVQLLAVYLILAALFYFIPG